MTASVLRYAVIPGTILTSATLARAWLELHAPEHAKYLSVLAATFALLIVYPTLLRPFHFTLGRYLRFVSVFLLLVRVPISTMYALAFAGDWRVAGTDRPVRYITDLTGNWPNLPHDASPWAAFALTLFASMIVHLTVATLAFVVTRKLRRDP